MSPVIDAPLPVETFVDALSRMNPQGRRDALERAQLPRNIGALLDQAAAEAGGRDALNFFELGEKLTYAELVEKVGQAVNTLLSWGVTRGTHVAVMLPNIPEMPIIWLALARIGAVMAPVNTRYTARELHYVVTDSEAEFLIVHADHAALAGQLSSFGEVKVTAGRIAAVGAAETYRSWSDMGAGQPVAVSLDYEVDPDDLMNIQYTSGTTGFPKGCMLTHRYWVMASFVNGLRDGRRYERVFASTPFFYLDPQWLMLLAFHQRATLFVANRQSSSRFAGWLREHRIHFCLFPEIAYKQPPSPQDGELVVRRANIYGVRKQIHADLRRRFNLPAMEAFGMTEVGPTLYMPLEHTEMVGSGSCGIPAPFRECRVVDDEGIDVARGEEGELVVRGLGIMQGYYKKPDANKESFFGEWFRTGDLFRQDEKGFFYIVGRKKDMVRRAGENVAAREVEAVLRDGPCVLDAAVVGVPDDLRGQEVKAYIVPAVPQDEAEAVVEAAIAHCVANLAAFKVPRYYEIVESLPRTPSEKIAKGELIKAKEDLRTGSFDRVDKVWR